MELIYAIYKENIIPLVGGVNPDGIEIGMAEYNGWKLCAMQESEFNKFSEFRLYPVPKSIAVGLVLAGRTQYNSVPGDVGSNAPPAIVAQTNTKMNQQEQELVRLAKEYMAKLDLKFVTRAKIRQFKDFEDDLSDTKLLVEFLLGYIVEDYSTKSTAEKDKYPIKDLMNSFVQAFEGKDLRINNTKIIGKVSQIIKDESIISRIVKSNYIEKLNIEG
jgi:hypothetical protein